jgi:endonuclease G, mitochondrial
MIEDCKALVTQVAPEFLAYESITTIGVGYEIRNGRRTKKLSLQYTLIPDADEPVGLPVSLKTRNNLEIAVQLLRRPKRKAMKKFNEEILRLRHQRLDIIAPGASISSLEGNPGTLGAIVFDRISKEPMMLSCQHLMKENEPVFQPKRDVFDWENHNLCGETSRRYLGIPGDAAVAKIINREYSTKILGLDVSPKHTASAQLGDLVVKSGASSGVTFGIVTRVGVIAELQYRTINSQKISCFEITSNTRKQSRTTPLCLDGDSGSLWMLDGSDVAVGLHFAGECISEFGSSFALACQIDDVMNQLGVEFRERGN